MSQDQFKYSKYFRMILNCPVRNIDFDDNYFFVSRRQTFIRFSNKNIEVGNNLNK